MMIKFDGKRARINYLPFPMFDSVTPAALKTGLSPTDDGYYKDGAGAWTALSIADTASEIGATGIYEINLSATESDHDQATIIMSAAGAITQVVCVSFDSPLSADRVTAGRTWVLRRVSAYEADNVITLPSGFSGVLGMDFSRILNPSTSLAGVSSVSDALSASPAIVVTNLRVGAASQVALFDVATITDATSYRMKVTVTTSDGDTLVGFGALKGDDTP